MLAVMNDVGWDWVRTLKNKINWHWAVHCENDVIDLNYETCDNLTEWKLLNTQHYDTDWTEQIIKTQMFFFERRIIVTEFTIESSSSFTAMSSLTFA